MTTCTKCSQRVSETADHCPGCGEDFAARRRHEAVGHVLALAVMVVVAVIVGIAILSPGVIINVLRGRYSNCSGNILWASVRDWQTWLISLPIAAAVFVALRLAGAFSS
jgi:hypothetical protein